MWGERKISPERRKLYQERGWWKDKTLLDCWRETLQRYPDREYVADDRGFRYTLISWQKLRYSKGGRRK